MSVRSQPIMVVVRETLFRILRGEHNQAFNYAAVGRRTCVARLLTNRYVAKIAL